MRNIIDCVRGHCLGPQNNRIVTPILHSQFLLLTINSVYQFTPKCIDLREHPVLLTLTKAESFYFTFNINWYSSFLSLFFYYNKFVISARQEETRN